MAQVLGASLEALCGKARQVLVLAAPFVKAATLERLLRGVSEEVVVRCITRWRPEEVAAGVSDLEVWPMLRKRPNASLWLCPNLHAKYYRADADCLIGSANLTATALGWSRSPNLELLVALSASHPSLVDFEAALLLRSVQADDDIHLWMSKAVQAYEEHLPVVLAPKYLQEVGAASPSTWARKDLWLPLTRFPDALFSAYSGDEESLSMAARESTRTDLLHLDVPSGLPRPAFEAYVGALLLQQPLIQRVDALVALPQRFGAVRGMLNSAYAQTSEFDASRAWQTLMRWLLHFLPDRYELQVPNYSEVFGRRLPTANADE